MDPVRFSRLKQIARSPLHYRSAVVEETSAMEKGSAVHSMILGGAPIVAWQEGRPRRGKKYDAFVADLAPGSIVLTATAFGEACAVADAVRANPLAMAALEGQREAERSWKFGQRACAGRIDCITADGVTELKVTQSSDPNKVTWQALRMAWFAQLAWYLDGCAAGGLVLDRARIVAVEPVAPFAVTVFRLSDRSLDQARRTYRTWFERLLVCESTNEWPAYAQSEVELDVPDNDVALDFGDAEAA